MGRRKSLTLELSEINRLGSQGRTGELLTRLSTSERGDTAQRVAIVHALGAAGDHEAVKALTSRLEDPSEEDEVGWHAARALGEAGNPVAIASLRAAVSSDDHRLQVSAVVGLGGIGDEEAIEPLLRALASEDRTLRYYTVEALGGFAHPRVVSALIEALADKRRGVRRGAAKSLVRIGDPRAVAALRARAAEEGFILRGAFTRLADQVEAGDRHRE